MPESLEREINPLEVTGIHHLSTAPGRDILVTAPSADSISVSHSRTFPLEPVAYLKVQNLSKINIVKAANQPMIQYSQRYSLELGSPEDIRALK